MKVSTKYRLSSCPLGVKIAKAEVASLPLTRRDFHGDWNYILHPSGEGITPGRNYNHVILRRLLTI